MQLPDSFLQHTGRVLSLYRPAQGENSDVTMVTGERGNFVIKQVTREAQARHLAAEFRVLSAIAEHYPFVPAPLAATEEMMLMTRLPGQDLVALIPTLSAADKHRLMAETAEALRRVHAWRPNLPPPPDHVFEALAKAGVEPDIVFAHGDFCLPNVMVNEGHISAIIDWPHAGYTDRRVDLAAAVWSIRRNLGSEEYVEKFLRTYGYAGGDLGLFDDLWRADS